MGSVGICISVTPTARLGGLGLALLVRARPVSRPCEAGAAGRRRLKSWASAQLLLKWRLYANAEGQGNGAGGAAGDTRPAGVRRRRSGGEPPELPRLGPFPGRV